MPRGLRSSDLLEVDNRRLREIHGPGEWYRFGYGALNAAFGDTEFRQRFRSIFTECACDPQPVSSFPTLHFRVYSSEFDDLVVASLERPGWIDLPHFVRAVFPDCRFIEIPCTESGWRWLAESASASHPILAFRDDLIVAPRSYGWQGVLAYCAVNLVMLLQEDVVFLHAASVAINGKGILIFGNKGAGKTTIALALAGAGHSFFGDECAAVSTSDLLLLPFRRTASIRQGPQHERVVEFLESKDRPIEVNLDGTLRRRAAVGEIFPAQRPSPVRVTHSIFLRRFASQAELESFTPGLENVSLLSPLTSSVWGGSLGQKISGFLKLISRTNCFFLDPGGRPEETAKLLERAVV